MLSLPRTEKTMSAITRKLWLFLIACLLMQPVSAVQLDDSLVLNAYGTLGLTRSSLSDPGYRTGHSYQFAIEDHWSGRADNSLGLQLAWHPGQDVSVIVQALTRRNGADKVHTGFPWAYVRWRPDTQWDVRLGRQRQPLFLITEDFDVGYAHPWARPPAELYTVGGEQTTIDGIDLRHRVSLAGYTLALEAFIGVNCISRPQYYNCNKYNKGLAVSLIDTELTLRASLLDTDTKLIAPGVGLVHDVIALQDTQVAGDYAAGRIPGVIYGNLAMRYEARNWLLMTEYVQTHSPSRVFPVFRATYVTLGRTFANWQPYFTAARLQTMSSAHENRLSGLAGHVANAFLATQQRSQTTLSLGTRWDALDGIAFKAQYDRVRPDHGTYGLQASPLPADRSAFSVFSLVMDWAY